MLLIAFCMAAMMATAQNDSIPTTGIAQDDSSYVQEEVEYRAPRRNPIYYFDSPFASHFVECKMMAGAADLGLGVEYAYLSEVWGFHVSGIAGIFSSWGLAGVNYRLSSPWANADYQVYGSFGFRNGIDDSFVVDYNTRCMRPALELGMRVSAVDGWGRFSTTSVSLGYLTDFTHNYVTLGLNVSICTAITYFFWFL